MSYTRAELYSIFWREIFYLFCFVLFIFAGLYCAQCIEKFGLIEKLSLLTGKRIVLLLQKLSLQSQTIFPDGKLKLNSGNSELQSKTLKMTAMNITEDITGKFLVLPSTFVDKIRECCEKYYNPDVSISTEGLAKVDELCTRFNDALAGPTKTKCDIEVKTAFEWKVQLNSLGDPFIGVVINYNILLSVPGRAVRKYSFCAYAYYDETDDALTFDCSTFQYKWGRWGGPSHGFGMVDSEGLINEIKFYMKTCD